MASRAQADAHAGLFGRLEALGAAAAPQRRQRQDIACADGLGPAQLLIGGRAAAGMRDAPVQARNRIRLVGGLEPGQDLVVVGLADMRFQAESTDCGHPGIGREVGILGHRVFTRAEQSQPVIAQEAERVLHVLQGSGCALITAHVVQRDPDLETARPMQPRSGFLCMQPISDGALAAPRVRIAAGVAPRSESVAQCIVDEVGQALRFPVDAVRVELREDGLIGPLRRRRHQSTRRLALRVEFDAGIAGLEAEGRKGRRVDPRAGHIRAS